VTDGAQLLSLGVEEEFHAVDPATHALANDGESIAEGLEDAGEGAFAGEIKRSMVETCTAVCSTLAELRGELVRLRGEAIAAAGERGRRLAASGTLPLADWRDAETASVPRYHRVQALHQQVAADQIVCGLHVHVGIDDRELAVQVHSRARLWLSPLLALSASSPYWTDVDTGYASYRPILWGHWPTADVPGEFSSVAEYDAVVAALVDTATVVDDGQIYWDLRLSAHQPTLEFRVADACTTIDEAVLQAGLCRALARTCAVEAERGDEVAAVRTELLRAAKWRAARFGITERLLDLRSGRLVGAAELMEGFLEYLRPALEEAGDFAEVGDLLGQALRRGTGSQRQRAAFARTSRLEAVIDLIADETAAP